MIKPFNTKEILKKLENFQFIQSSFNLSLILGPEVENQKNSLNLLELSMELVLGIVLMRFIFFKSIKYWFR